MGYYITAELEVKNIKEQEKEEVQEFIDCCDKLGLKIVAEDIKFIDEVHIW